MKFIYPVPITETAYLSSSAGALSDSTVAENSYPTWVSGGTYPADTVVEYSSQLYRCIREHKKRSRTPDTDSVFWTTATGSLTYSAWSGASVSYIIGDVVIRESTHRKYKCVQAHTSAADSPPETDIDNYYWTDYGPTNKWAMFDDSPTTVTMGDSPLTFTIQPGLVDSIALLGLVGATSVTVTMYDEHIEVYTQTVDLDDSQEISDWWEYFFSPFSFRENVVLSDLPPYQSGEIVITVTGTSTVGVGICAVGTTVNAAKSEYGTEIGLISFSKKDTDERGNITLVKRANSKRFSVPIMIDNDLLDYTERKLREIDAIPVVWYDDSGYDALTVYGIYKDWTIVIEHYSQSRVNLEIEGLS